MLPGFPRILESSRKSWIFAWIFQALESPGNESLRLWKVLENELSWIVYEFTGGSK